MEGELCLWSMEEVGTLLRSSEDPHHRPLLLQEAFLDLHPSLLLMLLPFHEYYTYLPTSCLLLQEAHWIPFLCVLSVCLIHGCPRPIRDGEHGEGHSVNIFDWPT